ncbi:MauE/DoxX family redox-associated membrane protein [Streptomyces sp. N2A]|uniref:MauE/DoxX family redox-associated membrane protein n=1 Tax=Streptomyces sp. N2A TaxID=3073936 RepID=UPI002870246A|nr:MauE/DoxX family redox-associated membrane protein [Streptomyces sp. N2A]
MDALVNFCRSCLFLTFAGFALSKVIGFKAFRSHVQKTVSTVPGSSTLIAGAVVVAEALACACLLWNSTAPAGFAALGALLAVFTAYLCKLLARGRGESCGCAGQSDSPVTVWHVARNVMLFCLSAGGLLAASSHSAVFDVQDWLRVPAAFLLAGPAYFLDDLIDFFGRKLT